MIGWSGVGDGVGQQGCVDADRLLLLVARDVLRDQSARSVDGAGETYLDRATMAAGRGAGTSEPSGGGGERLRGREETGQR